MVDYKQQIMNWEKKMESSLMMFMRQLLCMLRRNNLQACIPKGRQCEKKGLACFLHGCRGGSNDNNIKVMYLGSVIINSVLNKIGGDCEISIKALFRRHSEEWK